MLNNYNPYFSYMQPQMSRINQPMQPMQTYQPPIGLQGKIIDNLEVVKAMDIPLDGSISYFPLADGTAIAVKQLQQDGTSKVTIYKPVDANEQSPKYATIDDITNAIKGIDDKPIRDIKEDIKNLKRQIRDLTEDLSNKDGE